MSDRKPPTRGRQRDVVAYLYEYAGRDITIAQLERFFRGRYSREQLMATMNGIINPPRGEAKKLPVTKLTNGVWRLDEFKATGPEKQWHDLDPQPPKEDIVEPVPDKYGEPVQKPDVGLNVKVRNGILYVDDNPTDPESFFVGLRLALRIG